RGGLYGPAACRPPASLRRWGGTSSRKTKTSARNSPCCRCPSAWRSRRRIRGPTTTGPSRASRPPCGRRSGRNNWGQINNPGRLNKLAQCPQLFICPPLLFLDDGELAVGLEVGLRYLGR